MKRIRNIIALLCIALHLAGCASSATTQSEWLPSISEPVTIESGALRDIPIPEITNAQVIWVRHVDLDADGKEDCIVTVRMPDELGLQWGNLRHVTHVFRGGEQGAFGGFATAEPWFFVVTYEGHFHVKHGDKEIRHLFSLSKQEGEWVVTLKQYEYGNDGGDPGERLMSPRKTTTTRFPIKELSNQKLSYIGTYPAEK